MLYCPQCGAEYHEGYSSCSDCHVLLVRERPQRKEMALETVTTSTEETAQPGDPNRDPFCSFWRGYDAQICEELCIVLNEADIPHRTVHRADHLFHLTNQVPYELGVPASLYEKAELAVKEAFGTDEETGKDAVPLLPSPFPKFEEDPLDRNTDDATLQVWLGQAGPLQEKIEDSFRENKILSRWQWQAGSWLGFVLPEDEPRAREIIREIVNATPPE
jgi:hypothetical protein